MNKKERIDELIEKSGLKRTFIAERMGITPATLSRKIKDPSTFNGIQMAELAKIFRVNIVDIDFEVLFFDLQLEFNSSEEVPKN